MARKKGERHGGDGAKRESHAAAAGREEGQSAGRENGARRGAAGGQSAGQEGDVIAAAAAMPPALPPPDSGATGTTNEAMERAEELVDEWAERIGHYAGQAGHQVLRVLARAREEAEDIWAEAQSVRHGEGGQMAAEETAAGAAAGAAESGTEALRRADEMVDQASDRVGKFAFGLGQQLRRLAARAREEAEDIWAEAQTIRQKQQPSAPAPQESQHGV